MPSFFRLSGWRAECDSLTRLICLFHDYYFVLLEELLVHPERPELALELGH